MSKSIEELLAPKPEARLRIYAYTIEDKAHAGLLKVGQTTRDVKQRVCVSARRSPRDRGDIEVVVTFPTVGNQRLTSAATSMSPSLPESHANKIREMA